MDSSHKPATQSVPSPWLTARRVEWLLFFACFFAFAYFNQGGGWNQNARFAEVRAIVEQGRYAIDDYLIYKRDPASPDGNELIRIPVKHAQYEWEGEQRRLSWVSMAWEFFPVNESPADPGVKNTAMVEECNTGDIGYIPHTGHFHPNKPPGTSFLGVPAYFLIYHLERALGVNPDHWWPLTLNAWLTSVFSVGLMSAFGCVLVFRFARELSGDRWLPSLLAAIALAFGTTYFPFATLFFDHSITATLLFASFFCLWRIKGGANVALFAFLAGLAAGYAALTNYIAAGAGVFLGLYALLATQPIRGGHGWNWQAALWNWQAFLWWTKVGAGVVLFAILVGRATGYVALTSYLAVGVGVLLGLYALLVTQRISGSQGWNWRVALWFTAGVAPIFLILCSYNVANFGGAFKLANDFQNPLFKDTKAFLGMFLFPNPYVVGLISVSPYRGIFFLAPITLLGLYGIFVWLREKTYAAEARLCLAIFAFFFLINVCFNGYHGGFSAGPRYLVPGLPFLALPLVVAFMRAKFLKIAAYTLLGISIVQQGLLTATDAQNSLAVGGHARIDDARRKDDFYCSIVGEYAWPLFTQGRAWPVLDKLIEGRLEDRDAELKDEGVPDEQRAVEIASLKNELIEGVKRGDSSPMILGGIKGPVSVNPIGSYDGLLTFAFFPSNSMESEWNSFNIGEFLFPTKGASLLQKRASLLPLLLITGGLCTWLLRAAARRDRGENAPFGAPAP